MKELNHSSKEEFVKSLKFKEQQIYIFRNYNPFTPDEIVQFTSKYGIEKFPVKVFVVMSDIELPNWLNPYIEVIEDYFPLSEEAEELNLKFVEGLTMMELIKGNEEHDLLKYRQRILKQAGNILEILQPSDILAVGLEEVISLIEKMFLSEKGKGTILLGVPGTGKSLIAKNLAKKFPVIKFNISAVYSKYVGESEQRLRLALKTLEQFGQCIVFIDELEKALARGGSGVDTRIFGELLTFLQDKNSNQYFLATANDVRSLPLETLRPERWDFILGLLPPPLSIREKIIEYYAQLYNLPVDERVVNIENITPADISSIYRIGSVIGGTAKALKYIKLTKDLSTHFEETINIVKQFAIPVYKEEEFGDDEQLI